jgi:flagellar biosynthesis/type III secretory pathway chaperone
MESVYQQLVENLDQLVTVYRSLLDIVRREKDILVAAQIEDLQESNKAKETFLVKIRALETSRLRLARELANEVGGDRESPRLLDLANRVSAEKSEKLRNIHSVLDLLIRRLSEINKGNEDLVRSALSSVSGAMDSIRDTLQTKPTYARKGAMVSGKSGGSLVSKEV